MRQFSSYYLNPLALCIYAGLVLAGAFLDYRSSQLAQLPMVFSFCALVAMLAWAFNFRRLLGMSEVPASTVASAAQGYVELYGDSRSLVPTYSPIRGVECVWFRLWIYVRDTNNLWRLADYRVSGQIFELQDETGICRIDPHGAEIFAASRHELVQNDHKYIEDVLFAGRPVYVLGDLDTGSQVNPEAEIHKDAGRLITEWKQSKHRFLQRFDLNRDGEVDMQEWESAREQAYAEVHRKHAQRLENEVHLIARPANGRLFLISGLSPDELRQRYKYWAIAHFSLFCFAITLSFVIRSLAA